MNSKYTILHLLDTPSGAYDYHSRGAIPTYHQARHLIDADRLRGYRDPDPLLVLALLANDF